jgi:hypothetical protein
MLRVGRDGGLQNFELHGLVMLRISDEKLGRIRVQLENKDTRGIQLQVSRCKSVSLQFCFSCVVSYMPLSVSAKRKNKLFRRWWSHIFCNTAFFCFFTIQVYFYFQQFTYHNIASCLFFFLLALMTSGTDWTFRTVVRNIIKNILLFTLMHSFHY